MNWYVEKMWQLNLEGVTVYCFEYCKDIFTYLLFWIIVRTYLLGLNVLNMRWEILVLRKSIIWHIWIENNVFGIIFTIVRFLLSWVLWWKAIKNILSGFAWFLIVKHDLMSDYRSKRFCRIFIDYLPFLFISILVSNILLLNWWESFPL